MGQQNSLTISVVCLLSSHAALAVTMDVPMPVLFQHSPAQLGRNVTAVSNSHYPSAPTLTFKSPVVLNHNGATQLGDRCAVSSLHSGEGLEHGYFNSPLTHTPGGMIEAATAYEMRLISYQSEVLKIELSNAKSRAEKLELTCTHPNIQSWTVAQFEAHLDQNVRIHAPDSLSSVELKRQASSTSKISVSDLRGSFFNGLFGSGLPGTMGIQLLLGANLKAYAEETNASLVVGKRCRLMSQGEQAMSAEYLKGSKFAFREYRATAGAKHVELVFDNWNHSPHQVRVQCQGSLAEVKKMTFAEVEHDLSGAVQFYEKKALSSL